MTNIYNIIDKKKLDIVNKPISKAHGLPNECYTSKEYTLIERKKLFEDKWIVIGVASSLPNIGDAKPIDLLGMPILIVRTKNNQIKVFHNICSHRGVKLVRETGKIKNVIRCPYHSWSYDLDGQLKATPHIGGMNIHQSPEFQKSKSDLKEIRSYIWLDLIMININNNEISFEEYIKPLSERWEQFWPVKDRDLIYHADDFGYFKLDAKCNWKFAIENYCESYHLPWVHPGLNSYSKLEDHYHIQGLPNRFAGQGTKKYDQPMIGNKKFDTFSNWEKNRLKNAEYVALFPNVMIGLHVDLFYVFWLEPLGINKTKEHMQIYYVGNDSANGEDLKELRQENSRFWKKVMLEDVGAIESMQKGRCSPFYNGGSFSSIMDQPTHQFHKWVVESLI